MVSCVPQWLYLSVLWLSVAIIVTLLIGRTLGRK
jgi:hypothetical protein